MWTEKAKREQQTHIAICGVIRRHRQMSRLNMRWHCTTLIVRVFPRPSHHSLQLSHKSQLSYTHCVALYFSVLLFLSLSFFHPFYKRNYSCAWWKTHHNQHNRMHEKRKTTSEMWSTKYFAYVIAHCWLHFTCSYLIPSGYLSFVHTLHWFSFYIGLRYVFACFFPLYSCIGCCMHWMYAICVHYAVIALMWIAYQTHVVCHSLEMIE